MQPRTTTLPSAVIVAGVSFAALAVWLAMPALVWLWRSWSVHPYYSHGPILVAVAAYLVWRNRAELVRGAPAWWPLALVAAGAAILTWAAPRQANAFGAAGVVLILVGAAGLIGGGHGVKTALYPAGALLLAIPVPITERFAPALAAQVAGLAAQAAGMLGVPVLRAGVMLSVADGSYSVGGPCSGLRSMLALVSLAYVAVGMGTTTVWRRAAIIALAVPLALAANWLRLTGLLVFTHSFGSERGLSIFEGPASPVLFGAAMAVIVALCWRFDKPGSDATLLQPADQPHAPPTGRQNRKRAATLAAAAGVVALALAAVMAREAAAVPAATEWPDTYVVYADVAGWYERTPDEVAVVSPFDLSIDSLPESLPYAIGPWTGEDREPGDDIGRWLADPEVAITRTYTRDDGAVVWLSVFGNRGDRSFHLFEHTPVTCYPLSGWAISDLSHARLEMGPRPLTVEIGKATAADGELAFATLYLWRSPSRDARDGILSLRLAAPVVGDMTPEEARAVLTDDFLPRLFLTTLPWSAF